jgi:hypothetical protein
MGLVTRLWPHVGGDFVLLSAKSSGMKGWPAHKCSPAFAMAVVSLAGAGLEVTLFAFQAGALRDLCEAWAQGNEFVYFDREALSVGATASGTAAVRSGCNGRGCRTTAMLFMVPHWHGTGGYEDQHCTTGKPCTLLTPLRWL